MKTKNALRYKSEIKAPLMDESDILNFGQYIGKTVGFVLHEDSDYILWLYEEGVVLFSGRLLETIDGLERDAIEKSRFHDIFLDLLAD